MTTLRLPYVTTTTRAERATDILNATDALLGRLDLAGGCWADVPADVENPGRPRCAAPTAHRSGLCATHRLELCGDDTA